MFPSRVKLGLGIDISLGTKLKKSLPAGLHDMSKYRLISFVRNSTAWSEGVEYGPDMARYINEKLLIENESTNLLLSHHSELGDQVGPPGSLPSYSKTYNQVDPFGGNNALLCIGNSVVAANAVLGKAERNVAHTASIYVKSADLIKSPFATFLFRNNSTALQMIACSLNLATGTVDNKEAKITVYGKGWFRVSLTDSKIKNGDTLSLYLGTGSAATSKHNYFFYGVQIEPSVVATSLIKTTGVARVRAAEVAIVSY